MAVTRGRRRDGPWSPRRALLALGLSALALASVCGGAAGWIHAHGPSGVHVHLLAHEHAHEHGDAALDAWHAAQHRRGQERDAAEDEPVPEGLVIELPEIAAPAPRGSTGGPSTGVLAPAALPVCRWHPAAFAGSTGPAPMRSGRPPPGARRSGVAALLRSSHAVLI